ncbi:hypothetical protein [Rubellicoccus peritrichatus]|uniref:Beta-porphyranase A C-terminal domain-containing protein n=1 Tax=Rubellicoccus peritrichatus TaxID=3080537 RepID=A0AAQ3LAV1_9BACT|nr:hypothetical protein [Puniceicoccus sp. CR14]WOO40852.1 hypothetical protein RZN69_19690 [Puniceicoccus sp. CR14]
MNLAAFFGLRHFWRIQCALFLVLFFSWSLKAQDILRKDFTAAQGHLDNAAINGTDAWSAQGGWVAADTSGQGYTRCASSWHRAKVYSNIRSYLDVNETIIVEAVWCGEGVVNAPENTDVFGLGISDSVLHSGNSIPALNCKVMLGSDNTLRFGNTAQYLSVPLEDAYSNGITNTHWFRIAMSITRLATGNNFSITVSVDDVDSGEALGSIAYEVSDPDTYSATGLHPAMRNNDLVGSGFAASQVDSFAVIRGLSIIPVDVSMDLTRQLFIGGVSEFSRRQFMNFHGQLQSHTYSSSEANRMLIDLGVHIGRNVGGFDWISNQVTDEDPNRPGYIHAASLAAYGQANQDSHSDDWARRLFPDKSREDMVYTHHTSGLPHVRATGETRFIPINYESAAEWYSVIYQNLWTEPELPLYLEPVNEPFVHMGKITLPTTGETIDAQGVIDYHAAVIDKLHADVPSVKVGGPCSAWPEFSRNRYGHWNDRIKNFIDDVGDRADFVSWHIYSTMNDSGSTTPDRLGSNVDYMFDLIESYSNSVYGAPMPMLISEYGGGFSNGTSWFDVYSPLRDWTVLRSCLGKTMQFITRPDRIIKSIPFLTGKTGSWYDGPSAYPWVVYRRPDGVDGSAPYEETHLMKFYQYFKGVDGNQFPVTVSEADVLALTFVNGATVNLLLGSIDEGAQHVVDVEALLDSDASVQAATLTRIYWNGAEPVMTENVPVIDWSQIVLKPEEYVRLTLTLNQEPRRFDQLHRHVFYSDRTVVEYTGSRQLFDVAVSSALNSVQGADLRVGVTRPHGSNPVPSVFFNGEPLAVPVDWLGADQLRRSDFSGVITFNVPPERVQANNSIEVSFDSDESIDYISSVILEVSETHAVEEWEVVATANQVDDLFEMTINTLPGIRYQLQRATDLPNWVAFGDPVTGDGKELKVEIELTESLVFFRFVATVE